MLPWERYLYIDLVKETVNQENKLLAERRQENERKIRRG